jgi:beta-glucosidase
MAQILSGKVNPSAKLPFTIEKRWEDSPAYGNYDETRDERKVYYREGIFVGYRGYEKKQIQPLFPFGFGLSYTNFHYSGMDVKIVNRKEKKVKVTFTVSNIGNCQGMEIAQLYVRDEESKEERPLKELKGFEKVQLKPGESREVIIELEKDDFQYFSEKRREWVFEPGIFEIHVGTSYKDVRLKKQIKL